MNDFWKSYDITALEYGVNYQCYPLYGRIHLTELALSLIFILSAALWYRHSGPKQRRRILVGVTVLLLLDEAALLLGMALTGQWNWSYLPLHLCSINVFVCLYNTLFDQNWCKEELYALCIPGAALALLCPSWLDVPSWLTLILALGLHPRPAGALPGPSRCGRLPPQPPPGAAGTGFPVRHRLAHLFSQQVSVHELLFPEQPNRQRHHLCLHKISG